MDIQRAFQIIKIFYGSHSKAASTLGFSRDHYRALRNGRVRIPARTVEYIMLKAREVATPAGDESEEDRGTA